MSATATASAPVVTPQASRRWRITRQEFYRLYEQGFFSGKRVELIGGEVLVMPPMTNWHAVGIDKTADALKAAFGPNYWVRAQMTLDVSDDSAPDPDVAVIAGPRSAHESQRENPTTAVLVVEVSYTTVSEDRNRKGSLYASVGIAEYWLVNIDGSVLEVYRDPQPDPTAEFGVSYASRTNVRPGGTVSPLAAPTAVVQVADLLPV